MGWNSLVLIDTRDLGAIRDNAHFGSALSDMILSRPGAGTAMVPGLRIGPCGHSSDRTVAFLEADGGLHDGYLSAPRDPAALAATLKAATAPASGLPEQGLVALCILHDGLNDIARDPGFGPRLADRIEGLPREMRQLEAAVKRLPAEVLRHARIDRDIRAGNHANPASIGGIIPHDTPSIIVTGGNLCRVLHGSPEATWPWYPPAALHDRLRDIWREDVAAARRVLRRRTMSDPEGPLP